MSSLSDLISNKPKLKPTQTKITNKKGEVFIETKDGNKQYIGKTDHPEYFNSSNCTIYKPSQYINKEWKIQEKEQEEENKNNEISSLSFVTYNVWFSEEEKEKRTNALAELIAKQNPDIICLQEVTCECLKILLKHKFFQEYYCSDTSCYSSITPYGVIIFCKLSLNINKFTLHHMPSNMGRRALALEMIINNKSFILITAHLESLNESELRKIQLQETIYKLFQDKHYYIFMGDSNFCSFSNEYNINIIEPNIVCDLWKTLYPLAIKEESHTMVNENITIDRILYSKTITGTHIKRIGLLPIIISGELKGTEIENNKKINSNAIIPSDHVGLYSILTFN